MDAVVDESVGVELDSVTVVNVHVVVVKVPDDMLDVMVIEIKLMVKLELDVSLEMLELDVELVILIVCRCGAATNTRSGRTSWSLPLWMTSLWKCMMYDVSVVAVPGTDADVTEALAVVLDVRVVD